MPIKLAYLPVLAVLASGLHSPAAWADAPVTLQLWTNSSNPVYRQIVEDFQAENPGVTVEFTPYSTNQYLQNLQVAATNRTLPDVFFEGLGATLAHQFIDAGLIMNLDQQAEAGNWDEKYLPLAVDLLKWNDSWWEVPATVLGMGLFYRRDIFEEHGIEVPTTFEELEAAAATLKEAGITPISIGGRGSWMTMRFTDALIENFGGPEFHDSLYTDEGDWTAEPVIRAFTVLKEWTDKGYFTNGFLSIDPGTNYVSWFQGQAAMVFEGPWEDSVIITQGQDMANFGFFPFPTSGDRPRLSTFAQGWMVAADTEHPEEAVQLAEYMTSTPVLTKYAAQLDGPFANVEVPPPDNQPNQIAIKELMAEYEGFLPTDQRFPQEVVNAFFEHQDAVVSGTETPEEAAAAIQAAKSGQ